MSGDITIKRDKDNNLVVALRCCEQTVELPWGDTTKHWVSTDKIVKSHEEFSNVLRQMMRMAKFNLPFKEHLTRNLVEVSPLELEEKKDYKIKLHQRQSDDRFVIMDQPNTPFWLASFDTQEDAEKAWESYISLFK